MKNYLSYYLTILFLAFTTSLFAQQQLMLEWSNLYIKDTVSASFAKGIDTDSKGNIYIGSTTHDKHHVDNNRHFEIIKFSSSGQLQWTNIYKGIDSTDRKELLFLKVKDLNYFYVVGLNQSRYNITFQPREIIVLKYHTNGTLLWATNHQMLHPKMADYVQFEIAESGSLYLSYYQQYTYDNLPQILHLLKYDEHTGNELWHTTFNKTPNALKRDIGEIKFDNHENIYVAFTDIDKDSITGYSWANSNLTILKFDSTGSEIWDKRYKVIGQDTSVGIVNKMVMDENYNFFIATTNITSNSIFTNKCKLIKIDSSGNLINHHVFTSPDTVERPFRNMEISDAQQIYFYTKFKTYQPQVHTDSLVITCFDTLGNLIFEKKHEHLYSSNDVVHLNKTSASTFYSYGNVGNNYVYDNQGDLIQHVHYTDTSIYRHLVGIKGEDDGTFAVVSRAANSLTMSWSKYIFLEKFNYFISPNSTDIVKEQQLINVKFYPNPVSHISNIFIDTVIDKVEIQVYNTIGQQMPNASKVTNQHFQIHKNDYENGLYFYTILSEGKRIYSGSFQVF